MSLLRGALRCVCPVTTAARLTVTSLSDPAEPELLGAMAWLPDRTIVIRASRLCNANGTTFMPTAGQLLHIACASSAPVFTVYSVSPGYGVGDALRWTARRSHDGTRACGVHRR
jgi:hypothetical protein